MFNYTWFFVPPSLPHSPSFFFRLHHQFSILSCDLYGGLSRVSEPRFCRSVNRNLQPALEQAHSHSCPLVLAGGLGPIPGSSGSPRSFGACWSLLEPTEFVASTETSALVSATGFQCRRLTIIKDSTIHFRLLSLLVMVAPQRWIS